MFSKRQYKAECDFLDCSRTRRNQGFNFPAELGLRPAAPALPAQILAVQQISRGGLNFLQISGRSVVKI